MTSIASQNLLLNSRLASATRIVPYAADSLFAKFFLSEKGLCISHHRSCLPTEVDARESSTVQVQKRFYMLLFVKISAQGRSISLCLEVMRHCQKNQAVAE